MVFRYINILCHTRHISRSNSKNVAIPIGSLFSARSASSSDNANIFKPRETPFSGIAIAYLLIIEILGTLYIGISERDNCLLIRAESLAVGVIEKTIEN